MAGAGHNPRKEVIDAAGVRRVLIAPDSFKGSLTADQAAAAMKEGVRAVLPDAGISLCPVSDGGEGMVEILSAVLDAEIRLSEVCGPLPGQRVEARWAYSSSRKLAVIEMAEAAGLALVPAALRDPKRTTTYGVGQLIRAALDAGAIEILLGIGGSATNDGGSGMAFALGAGFLDDAGHPLPEGGGGLAALARIDLKDFDPRVARTKFVVACDVTNPLTGPDGAAAIYAPQKGASQDDVVTLDAGLERLAGVLERSVGVDIRNVPGSGAAGGLGGGLVGFCGATLRPGVEIVLDLIGFDKAIGGADLLLTGEGRLDAQLRFGKALAGVLRRAKRAGVPVLAVVGSIEGDMNTFVGKGGFSAIASLVNADTSLEYAIANAGPLLRKRTGELLRGLLSG